MNGSQAWRVFISRTSELSDYPAGGSYVQAVKDAVVTAGHVPVDMTGFPATGQPSAQECTNRVQGCDVLIGLLGTRYGSPVLDKPEVSYTELEFDTATTAGIDRLMFLLNANATAFGIPPGKLIDREYGDRQDAFRQRVADGGLTIRAFASPHQLNQLVYQSLRDLADTRQRIASGLDRERIATEPVPAQTSRFINPPPATAPTWFQDRHIETGLIARDIADPGIRMVIVVGRGGIGKTAMVCRLLKSLEAGRLPDLDGDQARLPVRGIVYLSHNGLHQLRYATLIADLIRLLPADQARPLERLSRDPAITPAVMTQAVLEAFPTGTGTTTQAAAGSTGSTGPRGSADPVVVVLLDNLEAAMDPETETLTEPALDQALHTLLTAPAHAVTVITTTRIAPSALLKVEPARQRRRALEEGLGPTDAATVLRALDDDGHLGLRDAPDGLLDGLQDHTRGFPRALEAVKAILEGDPSMTPADLLDTTRNLPEDQVVEVLVGQAYQLLDPAGQQVMQALAIYPAPVSAIGVDFLLQPVNPTINATPILTRLLRRHLVRLQHRRYHLHPIDRAYALTHIPTRDGRGAGSHDDATATILTLPGLQSRAADYFAQIRTPCGFWRDLNDITPQLAEFDLRCQAGDHDNAATVLFGISFDYLQRWGHAREALTLHQRLDGHLTNRSDQAANHSNLGNCFGALGEIGAAIEHYQQALTIDRETSHRQGEATHLGNLGNCYADLGEITTAIDHHQQALTLTREIGYQQGEATHLGNLGNCHAALGQTASAIEHHQQALTIDREIGYRQGEAADLGNLGGCYATLGEIATAIDHYQQALTITRQIGHRRGESADLSNLGNCYAALGEIATAIDHYQQALTIDRETGHRYGEAMALVNLGNVAIDGQAWAQATQYYREAIGVGDQTRNAQIRSEARAGLACCQLQSGDPRGCLDTAAEATIVDYPSDRALMALLAGIAHLHQRQHGQAVTAFTQATTHADTLLADTPEDYTHLDIRALALCGLAVTGNPAALPEAVDTFHHARRITTAPGIVTRTLRLLDQIVGTTHNDELTPARAAAAGPARVAT